MYNRYGIYPCHYCTDVSMYNNHPNFYRAQEPMNDPNFWNEYDDFDEYDQYGQYDQYNQNNQYAPYDYEMDECEMGEDQLVPLKDYGPEPFVINIEEATKRNNTFRTALWTGEHLQLTLMSINPGEDIGLENHPHLDQFIRIEEGEGIVKMGARKDNLDFQRRVRDDFIFIIPAGTWHNLVNTGNRPIKLYSIYAPPQHPRGTVHRTKAEAEAAEEHNHG